MDDGWQTNEGDWALLPAKFPNGDRDMKALVDKIHAQGFRAQLWWAPLAAKPDSNVVQEPSRATAAERRRLQAEDLLLERLVFLSRRTRRPSSTTANW